MTSACDDLIFKHLSDGLEGDDARRLEQAIESDPAVASRVAQLALLERLLPRLSDCAQPTAEAEPSVIDLAPLPPPTRRRIYVPPLRRTRRHLRHSTLSVPKAVAAIAGGLLLIMLGLWWRPSSETSGAKEATARGGRPAPPVLEPRPAPPSFNESPEPAPAAPDPLPEPLPATPSPAPQPSAPATLPVRPPDPEVQPRPTRETTVIPAWGVLTRADGVVTLNGSPAKAGMELRRGDALESASSGSALAVKYPDGTLLEIQGSAAFGDAASAEAPAGKTLTLARGTLAAQVARQPAGQPFTIQTPHAEVTVIGTKLILSVTPSATRLEVKEGRVRLARKEDRKSVDVPSGQFAIASSGTDLRPQPLARKQEEPAAPPALFRFDFEDGRRPDLFDEGVLDPGPRREGNRFCIAAERVVQTSGGKILAVQLGGKRGPAFRYADDLFLAFDACVPGGGRISIRMVNLTLGLTYTFLCPQTTTDVWTRFSMPLKDMLSPEALRRFREGDRISSLVLFVEDRPKAAFYVDNLEMTRQPTESPEKKR